MLRFIAKLFNKDYNPCLTCITLQGELIKAENRENKTCNSCLTLQAQLDIANHQVSQLMDRLLKISEPEIIPVAPVFTPPRPKSRTWDMQRKTLEEQDAVEARTLKTIKDLERELEVEDKEEDASQVS